MTVKFRATERKQDETDAASKEIVSGGRGIASGCGFEASEIPVALRPALLDDFVGLNGNGSWTLFLADLSVGEQTTVNSWGVEIAAVPDPSGLAWFALGLLSTTV